jgi:hypothetical protein
MCLLVRRVRLTQEDALPPDEFHSGNRRCGGVEKDCHGCVHPYDGRSWNC